MKKISLYVTLALTALLMGACSGDYTNWADPQAYSQENSVTIPGFKATAVASQDLATTGDSVQTFTLSSAKLPDGYALQNARILLTPVGIDNAQTTTVNTTLNGKVLTSDIQSLIESIYGKRPTNRTFDAHVYVSAIRNGQAAFIDAGKIQFVAAPKAPFIDAGYYLAGDMTGWDATGAVAFKHSSLDVYTDPVFTIIFTTNAANKYWKIIPKNNFDGDFWKNGINGVLGTTVDGDTSMEGKLTTDNPQAGKIVEAGIYRMTINMMDYTYKIEKLNFQEFMYMAGDANGWSQIDILQSPAFDGIYTGYMYMNQNGFKFCTQPNWNGPNYGAGFSTAGDPPNITLTEPEGFYKVTLDMGALSYSLTPITTIGVIGDATADGWNSDQSMTYDKANRCWVIQNIVLKDGAIKFRANDAWDISWGGTLNSLTTQNGSNIYVAAGTYTIKLYLSYDGNSHVTIQ